MASIRKAVRAAAERLALLALSLLVAFALVEWVLLRFFPNLGSPVIEVAQRYDKSVLGFEFFDRQMVFRTDEIGYLHNPAGYLFAKRGIADYGIWDRETPLRRVGDEYRILFLGDSVTAGYECNEFAYVRVLKRMLELTGRRPIVTLNSAHMSYSFSNERAWFEAYGAKVEPDLVLLGAVFGDFATPESWRRVGDAFELRYLGVEPVPLLVDFGAWNDRLLGRLRALPLAFRLLGPLLERRGLVGPLPRYALEEARGLERLRDIHRRATALGVPFALVQFPAGVPWPAYKRHPAWSFHETLARFCREEGIPYLDLLEAFSRREMPALYLPAEVRDLPYAIHLSAEGHRVAAQEIARFLAREGLVPARDIDPATFKPVVARPAGME